MQVMNLDESQRKKVAEWIAQGLKLSEIQNRLASELGVRMTYMDVRLLVDDLKLTPKDVETAQTRSAGGGACPVRRNGRSASNRSTRKGSAATRRARRPASAKFLFPWTSSPVLARL